jgi:protein O-mannosyl-transferase
MNLLLSKKINVYLKIAWPYCAIIAAAFFIYYRAIFFGYTYFDDNVLIIDNNYFLRNLNNISLAFSRDVFNLHSASAAFYRPLLTVSLMLDSFIAGTNPFIYHLTNILLHIVASCLAFSLLIKFGVKRLQAFALTLIFSIHPANAQAIAWIPGRNDSLLAVFALLSFLTLIRYWEKGRLRDLFLHSFFFACGIFTKETMAFFPFLCILYFFLTPLGMPLERRPGEIEIKSTKQKIPRMALCAVLWITIGIFWFFLRRSALANPVQFASLDIFKSLLMNSPAVLLFFGKIVFPFNLSVLPVLKDSTLWFGITALLFFSALLILPYFRTFKGLSINNSRIPGQSSFQEIFIFGLAWFLIFLIPAFIQPHNEYPASFIEHRLYVPFIGFLLILGRMLIIHALDFKKKSSWIIPGALVYCFSLITIQRLEVFSTPIRFWENAASHSPSHPLAHKNLGAMYYFDGKIDAAEKEYLLALNLYPRETMVHNNLGLIYKLRGDFLKAQDEYQKELAINPKYDHALYNWGELCYVAGNKKDAETLWLKTLASNPDYFDAMKKLSVLYREQGDTIRSLQYENEIKKRGGTL